MEEYFHNFNYRDPNRIHKILSILEAVWKKNPQLRLGQLICNPLNEFDLYYMEDDELIDKLSKFYVDRP